MEAFETISKILDISYEARVAGAVAVLALIIKIVA